MGSVVVYVSERDCAPYEVLVEERIDDRFDAWLDEHNPSYTMRLTNGEHMTYEASMILRRDPIAYGVERDRWVTYETPLRYMEMPGEVWYGGEHGSDADKAARDRWVASELDHDYDDADGE